MQVVPKIRLKYNDFFDDEQLELSEYLKGVSKDYILKTIPLLVNIANPKNRNNSPKDLIKFWFGSDKELINKLLSKIKPHHCIASVISSLQLVEYVLQNDFDDIQEISPDEFNLNLFKAYLVLNSKQDILEKSAIKHLPSEENERKIALYIVGMYHYYDIENYDLKELFIIQLIKSIIFFEYLDNREDLYPYLSLFLKKYNSISWRDWVKKCLTIVLPILDKEVENYFDYIVNEDENYKEACTLFESFCVEYDDVKPDFVVLRAKPILKIKTGHYRILNSLFLVEKLYKSTLFEFSLKIDKKVPKEVRLKNFKSDICDNFSEQVLCYNILKNCFPKRWIHISGSDFKAKKYNSGAPDYYIRYKNKIFLFESKDVYITGDEKQSRNYEVLKKSLEKKFYKIEQENKIEQKAVLQLIENVKKILNRYYINCDADYNPETVRIYPILITHDRQYDAPGVNKLVSMWFQEELSKLSETVNIGNIHDITIINIDTLILYQDLFNSRGKYRIEEFISEYHSKANKLLSFSDFINSKFQGRINVEPNYINKYLEKIR